jgi:hypothetical protein
MGDFLLEAVRTRMRRQLWTWAIVLAGVCAGFWPNRTYFADLFRDPPLYGAEELSSHPPRSPRRVRIEGTKAIDTGLRQYTVRSKYGKETGRTMSAEYSAVVVGERLLLVKAPKANLTSMAGELQPLAPDIAERVFKGDAQLRERFYPLLLDAVQGRAWGYIAIAVLALLTVLAVVFGRRALARLREPATHPLIARVGAWGDLMSISMQLSDELSGGGTPKLGTSRFTPRHVVTQTVYTVDVHRLEDLLWAHKKVTQKRVNGIPAGKTYAAVLHFKDGAVEAMGAEPAVDGTLQRVGADAPWAILGWNAEIEQAFQKQKATFVTTVDERRAKSAGRRA